MVKKQLEQDGDDTDINTLSEALSEISDISLQFWLRMAYWHISILSIELRKEVLTFLSQY